MKQYDFRVVEVTNSILSVSYLCDQGIETHLAREPFLKYGDRRELFVRTGDSRNLQSHAYELKKSQKHAYELKVLKTYARAEDSGNSQNPRGFIQAR